jgi:hypothetical protein
MAVRRQPFPDLLRVSLRDLAAEKIDAEARHDREMLADLARYARGAGRRSSNAKLAIPAAARTIAATSHGLASRPPEPRCRKAMTAQTAPAPTSAPNISALCWVRRAVNAVTTAAIGRMNGPIDKAVSKENVTSAPAMLQSQKRLHLARCISIEF